MEGDEAHQKLHWRHWMLDWMRLFSLKAEAVQVGFAWPAAAETVSVGFCPAPCQRPEKTASTLLLSDALAVEGRET